jgi:hypothetical protein
VGPFAELDADQPVDRLVAQWRATVVEPHAVLYRAVEPWLDPVHAEEALPELVGRGPELLRRTPRAEEAVRKAHTLLRQALPGAGPINAVLVVGLGGANGWATCVDGEPTLFLAVDRLPEPGFDVVLALHEMLHAEHLRRAAYGWPADRVDADLFREGLAVHVTTQLIPAKDAGGHLWFASGYEEWVARCAQREATLRRRAAADLERNDVSGPWFSGGPDRPGELPGRCGYWLGWQLVSELTAGVSLENAMQWSLPEVSLRLQQLLKKRIS